MTGIEQSAVSSEVVALMVGFDGFTIHLSAILTHSLKTYNKYIYCVHTLYNPNQESEIKRS